MHLMQHWRALTCASWVCLQGAVGTVATPVITSVTPPPAGFYGGSSRPIYLQVNFSEPVTVTGHTSITIGVRIGSTNRQFIYPASGGNWLAFGYGPANGDNGPLTITGPITLNGGTIKGADGTDASLAFTPVDAPSVVFDTVAPPAPVFYGITPQFPTSDQSFTLNGSAEPGSTVVFQRGGSGVADAHGNWSVTFAPMPAGTYDYNANARDQAANYSSSSGLRVSIQPATAPAGPVITGVTPPPAGIYTESSRPIYLTVNFSAPVTVTGNPAIGARIGSTSRQFQFSANPGGNGVTFAYQPVIGDNGTLIIDGPLMLNGGTIKGADGTDASLAFPPVDASSVVFQANSAGPPAARPVVTDATVSGQVGVTITPVQLSATNSPTIFSAPGLVAYGLSISAAGVISGTPNTTANGVDLTITAANGAGTSGAATLHLTIAAPSVVTPPPPPPPPPVTPPPAGPAGQTITFNSPVSGIVVGQPIALGATTSSGLPVTYMVVSGSAALNGNVLTPTAAAELVVRATQAGNSQYAATSSTVNFGVPQKGAQSLALAFSDIGANAGPITLNATTSAGLPITYTVSGPATLEGQSLILTGGSGTVTVRATQPGNDAYNAIDVSRSFAVRAVSPQVFFGNMGADAFAAVIAEDNSHGVFIARLEATSEALVFKFKLNADGSFTALTTNPNGQARHLSGRVLNGALSGTIAELNNLAFTAQVQAPAGPVAALAGLYAAAVPGSSSAHTYIIVGPTGQAFGLALSPAFSAAGTGAVSGGRVDLTASGGTTISAALDAQSGAITGTVTAAGATSAFVGLADTVARTDKLVNLSARLKVASGDANRSVIAGFVISGAQPKKILARAVGPGLTSFNVSGVLAQPRLELYDAQNRLLASNAGWSDDASVAATGEAVGAFKLASGSRDAAVVTTLAPGAYTVMVSGVDGEGIVLMEIYDASTSAVTGTQQLVNLSTRGYVDADDGALIAGFVVTGNAPKRVLIRGAGPSLARFGVTSAVSDPALKVYAAGRAEVVAKNDNWEEPQPLGAQSLVNAAEVAAAARATGAFTFDPASKDAALVLILAPGAYSAVLTGIGGATGAGLVEVYEYPEP